MPGLQRARRRFRPRLAAHRRRGRRRGGGWRVHGQKIWTSYAPMAQWCFLLARTSAEREEAAGPDHLSGADVRPGIEVRPIRAMLGPHHLNEVFFDGVPVTPADVLGEVGEGWQIVQEVLAFERVGIARYARCERLLLAAPRVLGEEWETLPEELRARWARMLAHCRRARLLAYRVIALHARARYPRRHRRLPDRRHPAGPGKRRGAGGDPSAWRPRRPGRRLVPGRGRLPLAVLAGRPRWRPAASRCSASCWPAPC